VKYIFISGSSDIATAIIDDLIKKNHEIIYTYNSKKVDRFKKLTSFKLDIGSRKNISKFTKNKKLNNWENLVILTASQNPIGLFSEVDKDDWAKSIDLNFTNQMYLIREMLSKRSKNLKKINNIILWAGTGSNSAPKYYSAYTISKIALTKMCELLDKEFDDIKVSIIGPGWVNTKIHEQTIEAGKLARENYKKTIERFKTNKFNPMEDVVNCFNKITSLKKHTAGGRNFSVQFDKWRENDLIKILDNDENMYKLRRDFNDFQISDLRFDIVDILNLFHKNKSFQNTNSLIYKTFKRILYLKLILETKNNNIKLSDIDKLIYFFVKNNKKNIIKCLSSKKINIKKLVSILK